MQSVFNIICGFILGLLGIILTGFVFIEMTARSLLTNVGIHGAVQTIVLSVILLGLIVVSFRIFGRLFAVLLTAALLIFLVHAVIGLPHSTQMPLSDSGAITSF
ncbi:hypothetical protein [Gluconobacter wancherniae]|uniref:hypothetical protein n=1 Tax=Gluconobacter wancherniae TaxID=1307955 RepID=UPI001B8D3824|nr:hypothetical protein [Gluconobacter wancherniae]MBS1094414.1 hypothetical protein [Gluconobacter wancherniae]MBS1094497.1 hypothetical protein [Gluconobacter wancherniae]